MFLSHELTELIGLFGKFPGLGPRSARRILLHLLQHRAHLIPKLCHHLKTLQLNSQPCSVCGYIDQKDPCYFCSATYRDKTVLCVVAHTGDVWTLEKAGFFQGQYHVLGGVLSPDSPPETLTMEHLKQRLLPGTIKEVVLALNGSIEGQTTIHYLTEELKPFSSLKVSLLARGMPAGSELDYLDQSTLMSAFMGRNTTGVSQTTTSHWIGLQKNRQDSK